MDLKNAYYQVRIHPDHIKFLKFIWKNQFYKFLVLSKGLEVRYGPRKFTKLMEPPIAILRLDSKIIAIYIDDLINVGPPFDKCVKNVITINVLNSLGFVIHPDTKPLLLPKQETTFLGININSKIWK